MRTLFTLTLLLGGLSPALAADLAPARRALAEERCADALAALPSDGWSTEALVIEGDAHRCLGDVGRATLAYLRAQRLSPGDATVAERLDAVALDAGRAPAEDDAAALVRRVRLEVWAWSAAGLASLALLLGAIGVLWTHRYRLAVTAAALALAAGFLAHVAAAPLRDAVVVAPAAVAHVSPAARAPVAFDLRPGAVLTPRARRDGFVQVEVDGRLGWAPASALASVAPSDPS